MTSADHDAAVRKINETLEGPVLDILAGLLPELAGRPREHALDRILDDPPELTRCLAAFRTNVDRFRKLLVDAQGRPVDDAAAPLSCGRSLDDIVSMLVRTAAKRYFRARLDHDSRTLRAPRAAGGKGKAAAKAPTRKGPSPGDQLYRAFSGLLAHDWQVALLHEYAGLSPALVRRLGPRLLDYRVPEDVRRLRLDLEGPPPPTSIEVQEAAGIGVFVAPPKPLPDAPAAPAGAGAKTAADSRQGGGMAAAPELAAEAKAPDRRAPLDRMLNDGGTRLRSTAFAMVLMDPKVRAVLPRTSAALRITDALDAVGAKVARTLVDGLGLTTEQLAVFLMTAHAVMGEKPFAAAFGTSAKAESVKALVERAKEAGIGDTTPLAAVAGFVGGLAT